MSLYIGENGTEKVLHVYNGSNEIQKNNFSGTSFHSSMPYIRLHSVHRFYPSSGQINVSQGIVTAYRVNYSTSQPVPTGNYSIIITGYYNGVRYTFPTSHGDGYFSNISGSYYGSPHANAPAFMLDSSSSGHTARCGYADYGIPAATMFGVAIFDYIDIYVLSELPETIISSDILVNKNDIKINNISIFNNIYVHIFSDISDRINDYDTIIAIPFGGTFRAFGYATSTGNLDHNSNYGKTFFQFINSYPFVVDSIEIKSNPSEILSIKNNMSILQFSENKIIKTMFSGLSDAIIHQSGTVYGSGTTHLGSCELGYDSNGAITVINYHLSSLSMYSDLLMPIIQTNGYTIRMYSGHYQDVYGVVDIPSGTIKFYIQNYTSGSIRSASTIYLYPYKLH